MDVVGSGATGQPDGSDLGAGLHADSPFVRCTTSIGKVLLTRTVTLPSTVALSLHAFIHVNHSLHCTLVPHFSLPHVPFTKIYLVRLRDYESVTVSLEYFLVHSFLQFSLSARSILCCPQSVPYSWPLQQACNMLLAYSSMLAMKVCYSNPSTKSRHEHKLTEHDSIYPPSRGSSSTRAAFILHQ